MSSDIALLLKRTTGLDIASIGANAFVRILRERAKACGSPDLDDYGRRVHSSGAELENLVEAVVVPETWFFRDREAFTELAHVALAESANKKLRLLSLPCSTGEEPYSMAMALLDAGVAPERFQIDAADISSRALSTARSAVYGGNSFRDKHLGFRARYFIEEAFGYRLHDSVRDLVRFRQANLFDAKTGCEWERYDIVFCRNLLIYFDRAAQESAIEILQQLLNPAAFLFVGSAEAAVVGAHRLSWTRVPHAFSFRLDGASVGAPAPAPLERSAVSAGGIARSGLDEAERLAGLGRSSEAADLCKIHELDCGPSARASRLSGSLANAAGRFAEATIHYRRALDLDPQDRESATRLAMLTYTHGDGATAKLRRNRARRWSDD